MTNRRVLPLILMCAIWAACTDPPPFSSTDVSADAPSTDMGGFDASEPDVVGDATEDIAPGDPDAADADASEPCNTLGCPCEEDFECASDYCIRIGAGNERICSEICVDECSDPEFECLLLEASGGDAVSLCVPGGDTYCESCDVDLDCGSTSAACLDQIDGRFCATPCGPDALCPEGAFCGTSEGVDGTFCIPDSGVCSACWDPDDDLFGIGDACAGPDCDQENESVFEGAPETCNGRDDDCDTVIDEGFDLRVDVDNCGACGVSCAFDNADAACEDGTCQIAACADGYADCNADPADGCEADLSDPTLCGACGPLDGVPGESCGSCDLGVWTCDESGGLTCAGDPGEDAINACGGCDELEAAPFEPCGTCGSGIWVCDGPNSVICGGDEGDDARNDCGGCEDLDATPETSCGTCDTGTWLCDGLDAVRCAGDSGPGVLNECGGCAPLEAEPTTACGTCDSGTWSCVGTELVTCRGDLGDGARNECGGCAELVEELGTACGPCGDGAVACNGINATLCSGATPDSDGDGVCDPFDVCSGGDDDVDSDGDGVPDFCDGCPDDEADDSDGDGVCDSDDVCPGSDDRRDADGDGVPDGCDDCSAGSDADDVDGDGTPDACDCDVRRCDTDATCTESADGTSCACNPGYSGDGDTCDDINECALGTHTCSEFADCTNTVGGFSCSCRGGFEGDGFSCRDINECSTGAHDCDVNATCGNTLGGFTCTCNAGYTGDGRTCTAASTTISFPSAGDTRSIRNYPWMWNSGDYYEGARDVGLVSVSQIDVSLVLTDNVLSCDTNDLDVYINGSNVGRMIVTAGTTTHVQTLAFAPQTGPSYTIRYQVASTVAGGCGSFSVNESASTVTFRP